MERLRQGISKDYWQGGRQGTVYEGAGVMAGESGTGGTGAAAEGVGGDGNAT